MSCILEFPDSSVKLEFFGEGAKQKILIDILLQHGDMDSDRLAALLDISVQRIEDICDGGDFLVGDQADTLAHLFLVFLGTNFFRNYTFVRRFFD